MIPFTMESIFLILSGVIVMAGILYWFWSHIQLVQKKVQLLENAVFEVRNMIPKAPSHPMSQSEGPVAAQEPYQDLEDDDWEEKPVEVEQTSTPLESLGLPTSVVDVVAPPPTPTTLEREEPMKEELQSGGSEAAFRELFVGTDSVVESSQTEARTPESLDAMPLRDLRRLAEQRGIQGAGEMRKKAILEALKAQISPQSEAHVIQSELPVVEKVEELEEATVLE